MKRNRDGAARCGFHPCSLYPYCYYDKVIFVSASEKLFTEEAYSEGVIRVNFLNCKEKY